MVPHQIFEVIFILQLGVQYSGNQRVTKVQNFEILHLCNSLIIKSSKNCLQNIKLEKIKFVYYVTLFLWGNTSETLLYREHRSFQYRSEP